MGNSNIEKNFLLKLITDKKMLENRLKDIRGQHQLWSKRRLLAQEHGRADLLAAADQQLAELDSSIARCTVDIEELNGQIENQRGEVRGETVNNQRSISRGQTNRLLDNLNRLAGRTPSSDIPASTGSTGPAPAVSTSSAMTEDSPTAADAGKAQSVGEIPPASGAGSTPADATSVSEQSSGADPEDEWAKLAPELVGEEAQLSQIANDNFEEFEMDAALAALKKKMQDGK